MMCGDDYLLIGKLIKSRKFSLYLIHSSLLVVGDCLAAKPSTPTPNNGGGWAS